MANVLLDDISEYDDELDVDFDWREEAFDALITFMAHHGHSDFTSDEFRHWAGYYCNLASPEMSTSWAHVFNKAHRRHLIKPVGSSTSPKSLPVRRWQVI